MFHWWTSDSCEIHRYETEPVCAGALTAESQEDLNLTCHLYDYNRVDKNGNLRELHIDKALEVICAMCTKEIDRLCIEC